MRWSSSGWGCSTNGQSHSGRPTFYWPIRQNANQLNLAAIRRGFYLYFYWCMINWVSNEIEMSMASSEDGGGLHNMCGIETLHHTLLDSQTMTQCLIVMNMIAESLDFCLKSYRRAIFMSIKWLHIKLNLTFNLVTPENKYDFEYDLKAIHQWKSYFWICKWNCRPFLLDSDRKMVLNNSSTVPSLPSLVTQLKKAASCFEVLYRSGQKGARKIFWFRKLYPASDAERMIVCHTYNMSDIGWWHAV